MDNIRYIDSLKDKHKNEDIWVIGELQYELCRDRLLITK